MKPQHPKLTRLAAGEYEVALLPGGEDAHIRQETQRRWVVDFFASSIGDKDRAHLRSEEYPTLKAALEAMGA